MANRVAGLVAAAVLALPLTACGSDEPTADEPTADEPSAEEPSSSGSESSASSSESSPAAAEATGEDYRALLAALFEAGGRLQGASTPEEVNEKADFPDGIKLAELDQKTQTLCIEDDTLQISLTFGSTELVLHEGVCDGGEDVATLVPKGKDDLAISGDKQLAEPVRDYFKEQFGS